MLIKLKPLRNKGEFGTNMFLRYLHGISANQEMFKVSGKITRVVRGMSFWEKNRLHYRNSRLTVDIKAADPERIIPKTIMLPAFFW